VNISGLFIRRPVTTTLVMVGILILLSLGTVLGLRVRREGTL